MSLPHCESRADSVNTIPFSRLLQFVMTVFSKEKCTKENNIHWRT